MTAPRFGDHYYDPALNYNHHNHFSSPVSSRPPPHGVKRRASDDEAEENVQINNDFKKLRLNNRHAKAVSQAEANATSCDIHPHRDPDTGAVTAAPFPSLDPSFQHADHHNAGDHFMPVDDTADRVYIGDLEAEIAAIEAEEAQHQAELLLSQAGQEMSKIPAHLLRPQQHPDSLPSNMQMVLYRDPTSISIPEEEDAVRKAIIAARARAREKQKGQHQIEASVLQGTDTYQAGSRIDSEDDADAMDIG